MISSMKNQILLELKKNNELMRKSLQESRLQVGKETHSYHYANENKMIAKHVLNGKTEKEWAKENNINYNIRKHMNLKQLSHLSYLHGIDRRLISEDIEYKERNIALSKLSEDWMEFWEEI